MLLCFQSEECPQVSPALTWRGAEFILARMNFDISHLLEQWDYQPGQVVVRRVTGKDGKEKIQLRVDLGILGMTFGEGDGDGDGNGSGRATTEAEEVPEVDSPLDEES